MDADDRKPSCVKACPTSARLFGDIHDPTVCRVDRHPRGRRLCADAGWGTHPANHYLPRRKTRITIHEDELERADNPLKVDRQLPRPAMSEPAPRRRHYLVSGYDMHPAFSVIFLTTLIGAAQGLFLALFPGAVLCRFQAAATTRRPCLLRSGQPAGAAAAGCRPRRLLLPSRASRTRLAHRDQMAHLVAFARSHRAAGLYGHWFSLWSGALAGLASGADDPARRASGRSQCHSRSA